MAYPVIESRDYTLPRGKLLFQLGDTFSGKFRHLGNSPAVNLSVEIEKLEHFSSEAGARTKDDEIIVQKKVVGNFTLDEPAANNLRMFLLGGDLTETAQALASSVATTIPAAGLDTWQQIQVAGVDQYDLTSLVVKDATDVTTYVLGVDYEQDLTAGMIRPLSAPASIAEDDTLNLTIDVAALDHYMFAGLALNFLKGHLLFRGNPAKGKIQDFRGYFSLTPSGDLAMIVENDWQGVTFDIEAITHAQYSGLIEFIERGAITA